MIRRAWLWLVLAVGALLWQAASPPPALALPSDPQLRQDAPHFALSIGTEPRAAELSPSSHTPATVPLATPEIAPLARRADASSPNVRHAEAPRSARFVPARERAPPAPRTI